MQDDAQFKSTEISQEEIVNHGTTDRDTWGNETTYGPIKRIQLKAKQKVKELQGFPKEMFQEGAEYTEDIISEEGITTKQMHSNMEDGMPKKLFEKVYMKEDKAPKEEKTLFEITGKMNEDISN